MRETTTTGHSPIRVGILHQNRIFRECLAEVLSKEGRFRAEQINDAGRGYRAAIAAARPDVLLIDLDLPEQLALDLTRHFHNQPAGPQVILLTHGTSHDDLLECFTAGAHGCVPEGSSLRDLCDAIEKVAAGEILYSHGVVHSVFHRMGSGTPTLTSRELQIVRLIAEHLSNKQIASRLSVKLSTVKNHIHNIVEKLDVSGRYEAVDFARKRRLLGPAEFPVPARREH